MLSCDSTFEYWNDPKMFFTSSSMLEILRQWHAVWWTAWTACVDVGMFTIGKWPTVDKLYKTVVSFNGYFWWKPWEPFGMSTNVAWTNLLAPGPFLLHNRHHRSPSHGCRRGNLETKHHGHHETRSCADSRDSQRMSTRGLHRAPQMMICPSQPKWMYDIPQVRKGEQSREAIEWMELTGLTSFVSEWIGSQN